MKLKAFSLYDSATQAYGTPFFQRTRAEAERTYSKWVNDPEALIQQAPDQFTLFEIAEFDDSTCLLTPYDSFLSLGIATQYVKKEI